MIITLKGANFADSNIGTLSTWTISRVLGDGATYDGVTYVDKNAAFNATVTIAEGYELGNAGVTVTMGGVGQAYTINGNVITISIASVTGNVVIKVPTKVIGGVEPETPAVYTITYKYVDASGATIKANTTETVTAGTVKNFSISSAAAIDGYTASSVSPQNATVNSNITVTYTYTANSGSGSEENVVFDLDLVNYRLTDYVSQGLFTVPENSTIDAIAYDANGANLNDNLPYGLTLATPIDASKAWTLELTMNMATPTDLVGNRKAIMTGGNDLAPMILINGNGGADKFGFQISNGNHTWVGLSKLTYEQDVTYKFVHDGNNTTTVYANGTELGTSSTVWTGKQFGTILGVIQGKSTAYIWKDVEEGKKSYLKSMKFYYN